MIMMDGMPMTAAMLRDAMYTDLDLGRSSISVGGEPAAAAAAERVDVVAAAVDIGDVPIIEDLIGRVREFDNRDDAVVVVAAVAVA